METDYKKLISESTAPFFTRKNLELLLGDNRRTTDYRITSLRRMGMLDTIKPGIYLNKTLYQKTSEPEEMARYIGGEMVRDSYISLEYALALYGILAESVYTITYITTKKTRKFQSPLMSFRYRNIKSGLFWGYTKKFFGTLTYQMASPAKALFDLIYLTPLESGRVAREFLFDSRFNWGVFTPKDMQEFKEIVTKSRSKKMRNVLQYLYERH
ncbi:MAG: hypothetical protein Q8L37_03295 [Candidatus Gottesmanbacteria bacterium]|nr:hypothetical protein [Candidatus Gottesmanbacteria bacterium]